MLNDDDDTGMGGVSPGSKLEFTPEVDATYYISVSTYRNNPNLDNSGSYTVSVTIPGVVPSTPPWVWLLTAPTCCGDSYC